MSNNQNTPATTRSLLLAEVEKCLVDFPQMTPESFGWQSVKDSTLVERLRGGGDVTTKKLDMILQFIFNQRRRIKNG
jgi:hypothetical protein